MRNIKKEQLEFMDWEFGFFFHFGIRTYYEGHKDWDMQEMAADAFNPEQLDCEQWMRTAKSAGAKYAILVCKHHDGFALWPSEYTDYSVANTPWKNGKGDVVREYVDACRKYGIKVGLYYSPAQFGSDEMDGKEYDDYFINQISELLGNYGKIDYLWFDGCGSEEHKYDTVRIVNEIRRLQPGILIFNMWDPDTRWVGNESGIAPLSNNNIVKYLDFSVQTDKKDELEEERFLPVECDCRIRKVNWFYSENDLRTLKSVDELMGLYYSSIGRGANLLLNISPDRRGLLPKEDTARVIEFGNKVKETFKNSIASMEQTTKEENVYTVSLPEETLVNTVVIEEGLSEGDKIEEFEIKIDLSPYGGYFLVYAGTTVGHKRICQFPTVRTKELKIIIKKERESHVLRNINVYYVD